MTSNVEILDGPATAQEYADAVNAEWRSSVEGIIGAGKLLAAARTSLVHGEFGRMFADHDNPVEQPVVFGWRTGRLLMQVANHAILGNRNFSSDLPAAWRTLAVLARLPEPQILKGIESGEINPELQQKDAVRYVLTHKRGLISPGKLLDPDQLIYNTDDYIAPGIQLLYGDFRDRLTECEPESIDLIVTDPPYEDEALPLFSALSAWASKALKPGGVCAVYTGAYRLPEVLNRLEDGGLTYRWTFCLDQQQGSQNRFMFLNLLQSWKPIIICSNGSWASPPWGPDVLISPGPEKREHDWQQSVDPVIELLERYSEPGWVIADPFLGGGTTGIAAVSTGRQFIGTDNSPSAFANARARISSWTT